MKDRIVTSPKAPKKPRRWIGLVAAGSNEQASLIVGRTSNIVDPMVGSRCTREDALRWMSEGIEVSMFHSALVGTPTLWGGNLDGRQ